MCGFVADWSIWRILVRISLNGDTSELCLWPPCLSCTDSKCGGKANTLSARTNTQRDLTGHRLKTALGLVWKCWKTWLGGRAELTAPCLKKGWWKAETGGRNTSSKLSKGNCKRHHGNSKLCTWAVKIYFYLLLLGSFSVVQKALWDSLPWIPSAKRMHKFITATRQDLVLKFLYTTE